MKMRYRQVAVLLLVLVLSTVGYTQVNVEKFRGKDSVDVLLSYTENDTQTNESNSFFFNMLAAKKKGRNEYLFVTGSTISRKNREEYKHDQFIHLRYFRDWGNWGPECFGQYAENQFSNQRERRLVGAGLRKLVFREQFSLRGGISLFQENLKLEKETNEMTFIDELEMTRSNLYANFTQKYVSVTLYYQPDIDHFSDYNIALESQLSFKLWNERLNLDIIYNTTKNNALSIKNTTFMQVLRITL